MTKKKRIQSESMTCAACRDWVLYSRITCCAYLCFNMRRMRLVKRLFNYDRFVNLVHRAFFCKGDRLSSEIADQLEESLAIYTSTFEVESLDANPYPASFHARNWKRPLHTQDVVPLHSPLQQPHRPAFL